MDLSCQTAKLSLALSKAQLKYDPLTKSKTARVFSKRTGKEFTYKYADLSDLINCTRGALCENELAVTQIICGSTLRTRLMHSSGESLESQMPLPEGLSPQEYGSALTYYRRYAMGSILGIAGEEDDDANAAETAEPERPKPAPRPQPTPPPAAPKPAPMPQNLADYVVKVGKPGGALLGKRVAEIPHESLMEFMNWAGAQFELKGDWLETYKVFEAYLTERSQHDQIRDSVAGDAHE